jgi:FkbM family methyltransferase
MASGTAWHDETLSEEAPDIRRGATRQAAISSPVRSSDSPLPDVEPGWSSLPGTRPFFAVLRRVLAAAAALLPDGHKARLLDSLRVVRRLPYRGSNLYLNASTVYELIRLEAAEREPWTVRWIDECVEPGDVMFDIGANVGAYSLIAAVSSHRQAQIYAFEPAFANYAALCRNIVLNGCEECITPIPLALDTTTDWTVFKYRSLHAGQALHATNERCPGKPGERAQERPAYHQPMLALCLDDLVERFGLPIPQHIKLDVDGAELQVLRGASQTLQQPAVRTILVELPEGDDGIAEAIGSFMEAHGFELQNRFEREGTQRPSYGLFVRAGDLTLATQESGE